MEQQVCNVQRCAHLKTTIKQLILIYLHNRNEKLGELVKEGIVHLITRAVKYSYVFEPIGIYDNKKLKKLQNDADKLSLHLQNKVEKVIKENPQALQVFVDRIQSIVLGDVDLDIAIGLLTKACQLYTHVDFNFAQLLLSGSAYIELDKPGILMEILEPIINGSEDLKLNFYADVLNLAYTKGIYTLLAAQHVKALNPMFKEKEWCIQVAHRYMERSDGFGILKVLTDLANQCQDFDLISILLQIPNWVDREKCKELFKYFYDMWSTTLGLLATYSKSLDDVLEFFLVTIPTLDDTKLAKDCLNRYVISLFSNSTIHDAHCLYDGEIFKPAYFEKIKLVYSLLQVLM